MSKIGRIPWGSCLSLLLCGAFLLAGAAAAQETPPTAAQKATTRLQSLVTFDAPPWRFFAGDDPRASSSDFDDSSWPTIKTGAEWTQGSVWLRARIEIPQQIHGYEIRGARVELALAVWGDVDTAKFFLNGIPLAAEEEGEPVLLTEHAVPGESFLVAVHAIGPEGKNQLHESRLLLEAANGRPDPRFVGDEFLIAEEMIHGIAPNDAARAKQLDAAIASVNWDALERSDQAAFDQSLVNAEKALDPLRQWMQGYSIYAAGNSHIDMAWLWPWTETVDVVHRTFSSALALMREFPDLTYTHSTAQAYEWMEEKYPALFAEIKKRVQEGRWEVIGGMWVEPDLNMPDGESQARQLLLGKRYFQEKFGVDIRIGWNPDSFGYNWQLPQIYKKAGVDFFVTQKLAWNDTTQYPFKLFWWESPDGSRVLTYFPHDYANSIDPVRMAKDLSVYAPSMNYPEMLYLFGVGDHGGGPTRDMLETAERWKAHASYPHLELGAVQPYFDKLAQQAPALNLPVWKDELYFQYHRGVFTSQAETKKGNRRSEELLLETEKFSSFASLFGRPYPKGDLRLAWKKVLFNQFHDVAAGSGIAVVYLDAARNYAEVRRIGELHLRDSLKELASHINTLGAGAPLLVFNPLSWARSDVVDARVQLSTPAQNVEVLDSRGAPVISERISGPGSTRIRIRFLAENVPPLGYEEFRVVPAAKPRSVASTLRAGPDFLENEFFRVQVDPKTGCITSLFDKKSQWESLEKGSCGNELQTFVDKPKAWDAWNIDADFEKQQWHLDAADEVKLVEDSSLRAVIRVSQHFQNSSFVQDITLYPHVRRVDVRMHASWHEKHILLKVAFPVSVRSDTASYEIPYGSIERPTTRRTPEERAKFEVPALRWADLSDGAHGLSLLNDCKYGYDDHDNVLRLSLLRSPEWPDPHADEGDHDFTYSFVPHAGGWRDAGTMFLGYELNYKLIPEAAGVHSGELPVENSFVSIEPANVVLTALKQSEDGRDLVLRFYEFAGRKTSAKISLPPAVTDVFETNIMEKPGSQLSLDGKNVTVDVNPYEFKTLLLRLKPQEASRSESGDN
ncbi:MAG: alpha-mannosidase [Candidatus Acidiferrales bacterium]